MSALESPRHRSFVGASNLTIDDAYPSRSTFIGGHYIEVHAQEVLEAWTREHGGARLAAGDALDPRVSAGRRGVCPEPERGTLRGTATYPTDPEAGANGCRH